MAVNEALTLNGLALNSGPEPAGAYMIESVDLSPPKKKPEWAQGADSDGAGLSREPKFENRTVTAKIRIEPQTTMNVALEKLAAIVDQLQEASKNPDGIPLVWTPSQSTKTGTMYVLEGEPTGLPIEAQGDQAGWFVKAPILTIQMICKPFIYGPEEEVQAAIANETGLSIVTFTLANIKGDVPAEGRLVVTDTAAKGRRYVEWGLEQRYYNAATSLVLDSEDMTPVGGVQTTAIASPPAYRRAGATKSTIDTTLLPEPTICANTGVLKHIGTFRVKGRVTSSGTTDASKLNVRLAWQEGNGPLRGNAWQHPPLANQLCEVDLGIISVSPAQEGAQKWLGQIEAYSTDPPAQDTLYIDYLTFIPVLEGYGKARGVQSSAPGTIAAFDNFTTGTLSGLLNARTPPIGAAWATSGAATDFTVEAGQIKRKTEKDATPRFAILGGTLTSCSANLLRLADNTAGNLTSALIVRWTNNSNYAALVLKPFGNAELIVVVAGVPTVIASGHLASATSENYRFELTCRADGSIAGRIEDGLGSALALAGSHTSLATGGTLASGKCGLSDQNNEHAFSRLYGSLGISSLPGTPYCIQPSQSMEVHSDSTIAEDSTGIYTGPVPEYRGSRFYVPAAGAEKRTSRIIVKADRNDLEESDQQTIADAFNVECFVTPRYLVIPR